MKKERRNKKWISPIILFLAFLFCFGLIFINLVEISLSKEVDGINLQEFALNRNTTSETLYADRGNIYDANNEILATTVYSYTVVAILSETREDRVVDKSLVATSLSPIIHMTEESILKLLDKKVYQVELGPGGRNITGLVKNEIESLDLQGIEFIEYKKRYYPNGDFASYTIGYAKQYEEPISVGGATMNNYIIVGELGIESLYEEYLKGKNGYLIKQVDRDGIQIPNTPEEYEVSVDGADVYLTIDSNIQRFIETALRDLDATYKPKWSSVTIMNAKTGEILGTSSTPSFDPNIKDMTSYENPLVSKLYEPGSVMKIYTYMCAIDSGKYNGSATFKSGSINIGDDKVSDWNKNGWGTISYDLGFEYSSNVGVSYMVQKVINRQELKDCFYNYGFAQSTGIELPRELNGKLGFIYPVEVANAAFGQGITTTSIQQLQGLSIIANDGYMIKPHIVSKVVNKDGTILYESTIDKSERIVAETTITKIRSLMYNVIYGKNIGTTGGAYAIKGFDIIGKTGTAQIYDNTKNKYRTGSNEYIYSFAGMFPKNDPEVIIYAVMEEPSYGSSNGLSVATKKIVKNVAKYMNIFDEENNVDSMVLTVNSYLNKDTDIIKDMLSEKGMKVYVLGEGNKIISQYPLENSKLIKNDIVMLLTNDTNIKMPDITGLSKAELVYLCKLINLNYEIDGVGYVYEQSIPKGNVINSESKLVVKLK